MWIPSLPPPGHTPLEGIGDREAYLVGGVVAAAAAATAAAALSVSYAFTLPS